MDSKTLEIMLETYQSSRNKILSVFGLNDCPVYLPIDDMTEVKWQLKEVDGELELGFAEHIDDFESGDFSPGWPKLTDFPDFKCVYIGDEHTLVIDDSRCDSNRYFTVLDNKLQIGAVVGVNATETTIIVPSLLQTISSTEEAIHAAFGYIGDWHQMPILYLPSMYWTQLDRKSISVGAAPSTEIEYGLFQSKHLNKHIYRSGEYWLFCAERDGSRLLLVVKDEMKV